MLKNKSKLVILLALLTSCGSTNNSTSSLTAKPSSSTIISSSIIEVKEEVKFNSVKEAIEYLVNSKNYTISILEENNNRTITNKIYFTENCYYDNYPNYEVGYLNIDGGVCYFDKYQQKFTISEFLVKDGSKCKDIWNDNLFAALNSLDASNYQDGDVSEYTTKHKLDIIALFRLISLEPSEYLNLKSFKAFVEDGFLNFEIVMNGNAYFKLTVEDVEVSEIEELKDFLTDDLKPLDPYEDLKDIRDMFKTKNYTHVFLDEGEEVGWEHFTPTYFYGHWSDEYLEKNESLMNIGAIAIEDSKLKTGYQSYSETLNGTYYLLVNGDDVNVVTNGKISNLTDISLVYNYPTYLTMFSNLQYFEKTEVEHEYVTYNASLIIDFINNFQLGGQLTENKAVVRYLTVDLDYNNIYADSYVNFKLYYELNNVLTYSEFLFKDFTVSGIEQVDNYLAKNLIKN